MRHSLGQSPHGQRSNQSVFDSMFAVTCEYLCLFGFPNENVCQPAFGGGPRGGWRRPKEDSTVDTATITTSLALDIVYFINVVLSSYIRDASRILTNQRPVA